MKVSTGKTVARIALRNLSRHRVKTIITSIAVAVSVCLYIVMDAWLLGMNLDSQRNIVSYEVGAAKIQTEAYFNKKDDLPMYEGFKNWEVLAEALDRASYDAAPRFVFSGTMLSRTGSAPMLIHAVDPVHEASVLNYPGYMESGRFPENGRFEVAVGSMVAEKLRVGIPVRPLKKVYEEDVLGAAQNAEERDFAASLYIPSDDGLRMFLREDLSGEEMDRLWKLLAANGHMDIRISTVIDMLAAPELIRKDVFEEDLLPSLDKQGSELVLASYEQDPILQDYFLVSEEEAVLESLLRIMSDAEYDGIIRHVNQLIDAVVVGVVNSPNPKTNANVAYLPLDVLQGESGMMLEGVITELLIRSKDARDSSLPGPEEDPASIKAALEKELAAAGLSLPDKLVIKGWKAYAEDFLAMMAGDDISSRVMILFLFLLSFIGIANTMLMAVLERTKEIGMMRALGMTDRQLVFSYAVEAGLIGLIGSLIGVVLGVLINIPMVEIGVNFSDMAEAMNGDFGYRITSYFRSAWNPLVTVLTAVVAVILSALVSLPPSIRAVRMPVTESLRFE